MKELVLPEMALASVTVEPMPQVSQKAAKVPSVARVGDLTPERFARQYPHLCQYFRDLDTMTSPMLFDREELHDFWTGPVEREGEIIQRTRILWHSRPVHVSIASMAIHTCTRLRMDRSQAKSLCMSFNSTGCCSDSFSCKFFHICLACGSGKHGFDDCDIRHQLCQEVQNFQDTFRLNPFDPSSKWEGKDLEKSLLKLVGSVSDDEDEFDGTDETDETD